MTTLAHICGVIAIVLILITGYLMARAWWDYTHSGRERHERWWD